MKYLKGFNEKKEREDIEEFVNTYLSYIIDDNFKVRKYTTYLDDDINDIAHHYYISNDKGFKWSDIAHTIIPMLQIINTTGYKLYEDTIEIICWDDNDKKYTLKELEDIKEINHVLNVKFILV